jgi:hypothetical protein
MVGAGDPAPGAVGDGPGGGAPVLGEASGLAGPDADGTTVGPAEDGDAEPDGLTAEGWQLCMRLLTAKSAMSAATARTARPAARRTVILSIARRV